ncbi:MAG TPA: phosphoheptose isomerase [Clostridiales bacterium]|nr:phosphoheptose isomerase [Clostridiales bacterium]
MSFMFHPYPYADPEAVNKIEIPESVKRTLAVGLEAVAGQLLKLFAGGKRRIGIDHYPGSDLESLISCIAQQAGGQKIIFIDALSLLKSDAEITEIVRPCLPEDRDLDPVLLYGVRYRGGYRGLQDTAKVGALREQLARTDIPVVVYGHGALGEDLRGEYDVRVWMDVTPRTAILNFKSGRFCNLGTAQPLAYSLLMRRNYYVDFELAMELRWDLLRNQELDYYISADDPAKMSLLPSGALLDLFEALNARPFRCRPVYLEGVWGGFYFHRLRKLPPAMRNCAWIFDMIPLEVSIVAQADGFEFEAPFFTFVQAMGEKLLGQKAYEQFGGYFPVRFNYDDTYHASGNMSIQCHPDEVYVVGNHGELGRQDESYYVCITGQGAKTYLGFQAETSCAEFLELAKRAEKSAELIEYGRYINAIESVPGTQVMIPAGTVHASGRNQVILEIGSLTIGSYTYKLYDYQRIDPQSGRPRPIHLKMGEAVLRGERTREWVQENLINHGGIVRSGEGWLEKIVGEHDLLYFSLRNLVFEKTIEDDTGGLFHVLALVDGEKVRVESVSDPQKSFTMNLMDIVVVPANLGRYRIVNLGVGTVTVHKTRLKDD